MSIKKIALIIGLMIFLGCFNYSFGYVSYQELGEVIKSNKSQKIDKLFDKIKNKGQIKVWIEYEIDEVQRDSLRTESQAQKINRIGKLNNTFESKLKKNTNGIIILDKMKYDPLLVASINQEGLEYIRDTEFIKDIHEIGIRYSSLLESTSLIRADKTWDLGFSGKEQVIVIIDTGVDSEHEMFENRIIDGACFSSDDPIASGDDFYTPLCPAGTEEYYGIEAGDDCGETRGCDHGTHVAGIAAGSMPPFSGVANRAKIIAINIGRKSTKADDCKGNPPCAIFSDYDIKRAIDHVLYQFNLKDNYNMVSVNLSLGGPELESECSSGPLFDSFNTLITVANINVVAASGNDEEDELDFPACIESVISVGSVSDNEQLSEFSNKGEGLDLVAPGEDIVSAVPGGSNTASFQGTSQAAPHVTGTIALMKEALPTLNYQFITDELRNTAYWKSGWGGWGERPNNSYGYGLVDTYASIIKILSDYDPNSLVPSDGEAYSNQTFEGKRIVNQDGFDLTINGTITFKEDALGNNSKFIIAGTLNGDSNSKVRIIDDSELLLAPTGNFSFQPNLTKVIQSEVTFSEDKVFPSYYNLEIEPGGKLYLSDGASLILQEGAELFLDKNTEIALAETASQNESISSPSSDVLAYKSNASSEGLVYKEIIEPNIPTDFELSKNYPNPFNPETVINYSIPVKVSVNLSVYDLLGRKVAELVNKTQNEGSYSVRWNASQNSSGVYIYRIRAGEFIQTKQMILLK